MYNILLIFIYLILKFSTVFVCMCVFVIFCYCLVNICIHCNKFCSFSRIVLTISFLSWFIFCCFDFSMQLYLPCSIIFHIFYTHSLLIYKYFFHFTFSISCSIKNVYAVVTITYFVTPLLLTGFRYCIAFILVCFLIHRTFHSAK